MADLQIVEQTKGDFTVSGDMTFPLISRKTVSMINFDGDTDSYRIDLAKVDNADSAGLALLVEWIRQSKKQAKAISFENIPEQLTALAKLSGFNNIAFFKDLVSKNK